MELDVLGYLKLPGSEVHSISTKPQLALSSFAQQDNIDFENGLPSDTVTLESKPSQRPSIQESVVGSARALGSTRMKTWFGESDSSSKHRGWRKAVVAAAILTAIVLLANVTLAIVAAAKYGTNTGVGVLYVGDCGLVDRWNTALHLLINILGTCLLSASSFTMQCISSPSRSEADQAHAARKPLEIGIPSFLNLFQMPRWKACLWWALCLSTMPLHLFWNSTVFSTIGANEFDYLVVEESFLSGAEYLAPVVPEDTTSEVGTQNVVHPSVFLDGYKQGRYKRVEAEQCATTYMATFVTSYRNFIAVTTPLDGMRMSPGACFPTFQTNLSIWYGDSWYSNLPSDAPYGYVGSTEGYPQPLWNGSSVLAYQPFLGSQSSSESGAVTMPATWPCIGWPVEFDYSNQSLCDAKFVQNYIQHNGSWWLRPLEYVNDVNPQALQAYPVDYCLVEYQDVEQCQLQYVPYILIIVICCNIIKLACMSTTACYLWNKNEPIFATVGDAVSSFMERPDETTANWCLIDLKTSKVWRNRGSLDDKQIKAEEEVGVYRRKPVIRLIQATSKTRWWTTILLCTGYLITGIGLLVTAIYNIRSMTASPSSLSTILSTYGLGKVTNLNLMYMQQSSSSTALISSILFANLFQVILSMTYFLFNSLWTAQCSAIEWASYIGTRKPLRVTWPKGQQQSTYYLNLPYKYGVPLVIMLAVLHFLISQSIFLARVQYYNPDGTKSVNFISTTAYSPLGLLVVVCVGGTLILALVAHSFRKIDNRIPVHGNSSAVISALCHTAKGQYTNDQGILLEHPSQDMSECNVQWGVVRPIDASFKFKNEITVDMMFEDTVGHCAFTADEVQLPESGQRYR